MVNTRMRRMAVGAILAAAVAAAAPRTYAQADAAAAYQQGKQAFAVGDYDKARERFTAASQTDPKNPEVFLWLGKAQYELGHLSDAVAAWNATVALAPNEPYAAQMLKALQSDRGSVDARLSMIDALEREGLSDAALRESDRLLANKALTDDQRAKALALKAGAFLAADRVSDAQAVVTELTTQFPNADPLATALIRGKTLLRTTDRAAEGLAMLKSLATDHAEAPAGAEAQYDVLAFGLKQSPNPAQADELAKWIAAHADHALANTARTQLVEADLALANQSGEPKADAALNDYDKAALSTAAELYRRLARADEAMRLTQRFVEHLDARYANHKSYAAAIAGAQSLLQSPLPPTSRLKALRSLALFQSALAIAEIGREAQADKLTAGPLPKPLADAVATLASITKEFPSDPGWKAQVALADQLRAIGAASPWPAKVTALKPAYDWAVQLALPVVKATDDGGAVKVVEAIVEEAGAINQPGTVALTVKLSGDLLAALSPDDPAWTQAAFMHIAQLDNQSSVEFNENVRVGKLTDNAKLSATQQKLIDTAAMIVAHDARQAPAAVERVRANVDRWTKAGQFAVAEQAFAKLVATVPEAQQRFVQLTIVKLWVDQAITESARLAAAGIEEPKKLSESVERALKRLYDLQAGVDDADPFLAQVRAEVDRIVAHYQQLQYFDVAEAAVKVKGDKPNPQADAYAAFEVAVLNDAAARREVAAALRQYKPTDKLALNDATKAAIAAYEAFITTHPADPLVARAANAILNIGRQFEADQAFDVAAAVYRDFAAFADKAPTLSQAAPGVASVAEQAAFVAVGALDLKAHAAMAKATAASAQENKGTPVPPTKLSDEFAATIRAYEGFIAAHGRSPLVHQALVQVQAIAMDYARADAWDVADGILATILDDDLATREPQRVEFCRGMCQVGKVMPEHAKEVLASLLSPGAAGDSASGPATVDGSVAMDALRKGKEAGEAGRPFGGQTYGEKLEDKSGIQAVPPVSLALKPAAAPDGAAYFGTNGQAIAPADQRAKADNEALAAISRQEARRASQIAMLRDRDMKQLAAQPQAGQTAGGTVGGGGGGGFNAPAATRPEAPVLSEEELARQEKALDAAYAIFQSIRQHYPGTAAADQSRGEVLLAVDYWRGNAQWQRAASLAERFLADNPTDPQVPQLRLGVATDHLAWAARPLDARTTTQEMLVEVTKRFTAARAELAKVTKDFPDERAVVEDAQWKIATSFLTQARTVDAFSATLARGQYVRAAKELRRVAGEYARHPQIGQVPQMLWAVSMELHNRNYAEEALAVWNEIAIDYPTDPLAQQAQLMTAQTYQSALGRPLRAAEVYLEINFARGGNDASTQDAVFAIGADLRNQKRWIESLHVLEQFVQSFPRHPRCGEALTMIGQIHQANGAWPEAIAAYSRVIDEFPNSGQWAQEARWAIPDCKINLSQWRESIAAYESFVAAYPKDPKVPEANRRIGVLKDLANYQKLVDENGPKAYDAQFQIASIVNQQLGNWRKGVEEFEKVATNWPKSHLAADALHSIGLLYLQNDEVDEARSALRKLATNYPDSPFASDALFQIGKSYEDEANRYATLTREKTAEQLQEVAQSRAYQLANTARAGNRALANAKVQEFKKAGNKDAADLQIALNGGNLAQNDDANFTIQAENAFRAQETMTATQLADRQDKINAALRKAVAVYAEAAKVPAGDKAGEALLHMAVIYNERLGEPQQAMGTWLEIVRQFSGTAVAEEASWQIAQHYEKGGQYAEAVEAYKSFLRNYRGSPRAAEAQFFIAENYEHLNQWIAAMDQYTNYVQNFPNAPLVQKAREQISFIKTYRL